jgi:hypothetical protein
VEEDEAGKLAAFRSKFGRGWDTDAEKVHMIAGEISYSCLLI